MTGENLNVKIVADVSQYKRDMQDAKQATKDFGNASKGSASNVERLEAVIKDQQAKLKALKAEYANLISSQDKSSNATKELETKMKLLNTQLTMNQQKLKMASAAGDAFKNSMNGSGTINETNSAVGELGNTLTNIKNLQMADVFMQMVAAVAQMKDRFSMAGQGFRTFFEEVRGAFDFKNMDVDGDGLKGYFESMKIQGKEAASSLGAAFKNLGAAIKGAMSSAAMAVAKVIAVIVALVALIRNAINVANRLTNTFFEAQKIGMTVSAYEKWAYIMGQVGVEADTLTDALKTLADEQNAVRDGDEAIIKAFNDLGISAEEASKMTQSQLFTRTVEGLQSIDNEVQRTSIAYRIFGEDAAQLTNVLNLSNEEMDNMVKNFYLLGGSASDGAINKSRTLHGALSNLRLAWQGLSNTLGEVVMPVLTDVVNMLIKAVVAINMFVRAVFGMDIVSKGSEEIENATGNVGGMAGAMDQATQAAEKLKRATQGFDELNIVSDPVSASSGSSGDTSSGGNFGNMPTIDYEGLTADLGLEEMAKWFEENATAIKNWTTAVVAATAAWKAFQIGFKLFTGEKIGLFAAFSKLAGWLGAVIGLLKEGNSLWAVLGAAFPKLAAAISSLGGVFAKIGGAIGGAAKAVAAFIGGLAGWQIALIIAAIAALASGIVFLVKNWDDVVAATKRWIDLNIGPIIDELKGSFSALWGALQEVWAAVVNLGAAFWNLLPDWLQDTLYGIAQGVKECALAFWEWLSSVDWLGLIGTAIEGLGAIVVGILGGVIGGAIAAVINVVESAVQIVTGAVQLISGILSGFMNLIVALFTGDFSKAKDSAELIWEGIKNIFLGAVDAIIGTVWGFIKGIIDFFTHMWDVLVGHSIVPDMIEAIIMWFFKLPKELIKMIGNFVKDVIDFFKNLATKCGEWASTMWTKIKKPFEGVGKWFKDIFTTAFNNIKNVFSSIGTFFEGIWTKIKNIFSKVGSTIGGAVSDAFAKAINWVLEKAIGIVNGFIKAINVAISVINAIPGVNISKISELNVPKLATGGIVTGDTLAHIGEGGKREAVLPLDQNTGWMDMLADRIAARNNTPSKIILKVGEKELGYATIGAINGITKQTGGLKLHIV